MTGSFATFAPLSLGDKLSIARAMMRILFTGGKPKEVATAAGISMLDWLKSQKQTPRAIERFWRVVLVSALDEELDRTDARFGIDVFWKAFLSNRTGYRMGVPAVPLAELYDGCRIAIERMGGEVTLRSPVRAIRFENSSITAVQFDSERQESADAYVFAIPHNALDNLLPQQIKSTNPALGSLDKIKVSPITGVHFWFDRPVTNEPFLTLLDTTVQWVFNKTALYTDQADAPVPGAQQYLQLVISASYDLLKKSREEIIDICFKEIQQALPAVREARLVKATVIKEASATFSPEPGVDQFRPAQATNAPGLFLAGDWTATGWPATMEGAVRSGYLAAEAVLRSSGAPAKFLQPDLAPTGFSRLFA
jgi:zeta-carotene desaturase